MTERSAHRSQNTVAYDSVKVDVETANFNTYKLLLMYYNY